MIYFADDLQSIPEHYRAKAKIVSGELKEERKPEKQNQPQVQQEAKTDVAAPALARETTPTDGNKTRPFSNRLLISIIVVVSALFAFVVLGILDADHKKAVAIARVVIVWGMSVYLIYAHAGDVVHVFKSMSGGIDTARRESEEKGKKAAEALKAMDALLKQAGNAASENPEGATREKKD